MSTTAWHALWLLAAMSSSAGCGQYGSGDYTIKLPGGYSLVRANHIDVVIQAPEPRAEFVIKQTVDAYAVHGTLVVGHVTAPTDTSREYQGLTSGYFILDTATGQKQVGLDQTRWLEELRKKGVTSEPTLRPPSAKDRQYESVPAS